MISVKKECSNCYHHGKMSCPNSILCYSTNEKPYFAAKSVEIKYQPTLWERFIKFMKG